MAMTVSMARALGLSKLAVPTQGNAGDSLATYAVAAGIEVAVVMSPDTDRPVLGNVAALAKLHPDRVALELVAGTIIDCAARVREHYVPQGYFSVATFQEPGWRTEGKKTLGLEMAEPSGDRLSSRTWSLPDVIVYPTGGGTGVVGMAKAFDELEALGLIGSKRPRMVCVQSEATTPIVRAFQAGDADITPKEPGSTVATGLNVAKNVGHINVLKIIRESGGCAVAVSDGAIRDTIREEWRERRFAWSPEGAATLASLPQLADLGMIREGGPRGPGQYRLAREVPADDPHAARVGERRSSRGRPGSRSEREAANFRGGATKRPGALRKAPGRSAGRGGRDQSSKRFEPALGLAPGTRGIVGDFVDAIRDRDGRAVPGIDDLIPVRFELIRGLFEEILR